MAYDQKLIKLEMLRSHYFNPNLNYPYLWTWLQTIKTLLPELIKKETKDSETLTQVINEADHVLNVVCVESKSLQPFIERMGEFYARASRALRNVLEDLDREYK